MKYVYVVLNWVFGLLLLSLGALSILNALGDDGRVSGLAFIASSMFILPIFRKSVYLITRRAISGRVRGMCITLLLLTAVIFLEGRDAYIPIANMTKVSSHYEEAIRKARSTYLKSHTQYLKGHAQETSVPEDAAGWVLVFNPNSVLAPGGGNAYLADDVDGDATTGAIGIVATSAESVLIARPAFNALTAETTIVTLASVIGDLPLVKPENTDM